jgi:hypothetical protein
MKHYTRYVTVGVAAALIAFLSVLSGPPTQAEDGDRARALLKESVKAMGGEKKCASWKTMVEKGELTVHWEGWGSPRAVATRSVKIPDKMVLDQDFSAHDHPFFFTYYYNAGDVWAVINLGVRQNPRYTHFMTRAMKNTQSVYYFLTECDTFWLVPEVPDDSLIAGSTVDRVGITDEGDTILVDLDKKTHLPVRQVEDGGRQHTVFDAWGKVNGLQRPYKVTVYRNGEVSAEYVWKEIEFDVPLSDDLFEADRPAKESSD